jgi:phosphohistidine phosphatase
MRIYLVQHGRAKPKAEDPSRPLTPEGIEESTQMGELLSKIEIPISQILHSGKSRAQQTANILALGIQQKPEVEFHEGLAPQDDPRQLADILDKNSEDIMIVGHLPHLQRLTSLLLTEEPEQNLVTFQNSGIVCLERNMDHSWTLRWAITPQLTGQTPLTPAP